MYPRWKYHRTKEPKLVHTPEHDEKLGPDWADTPAVFGLVTAPSVDQDDYDPEQDVHGVSEAPRRGRPRKVESE